MTAAAERKFPVYARGELRELALARFRAGLRLLTNPDTGLAFAEEEIALATDRCTSWWARADALDLVLLGQQARGVWLADQIFPQRASSSWLRGDHAQMRGLTPLPAAGGTGTVTAPAALGTTFVGSTTLPDDTADTLVHKDTGKRYQVLFTVGPIAASPATLTLRALNAGPDTNLAPGALLTWQNKVGPTGDAVVATQFIGGAPPETDAEFAKRLLDLIRYKQGAGNRAQWRAWARAADASVADAFVYPCAYHGNSTHVVVLTKRSGVQGPAARIAPSGVLATVRALITPPASPVVPVQPHVVVTTATAQTFDLSMRLEMPVGIAAGWADQEPWPGTTTSGAPCFVTAVTNQTTFQVTRQAGSSDLPSGVTPQLMAWNATTGRWESLNVNTVASAGGNVFNVSLVEAPAMTIAIGVVVSPDTERRDAIAETFEAYFDALGPGELFDLDTDLRGARAYRFPEPQVEYPQRAGAAIIGWLEEALGGAMADATIEQQSTPTPAPPSDPILGPALLVTGRIGIYPL